MGRVAAAGGATGFATAGGVTAGGFATGGATDGRFKLDPPPAAGGETDGGVGAGFVAGSCDGLPVEGRLVAGLLVDGRVDGVLAGREDGRLTDGRLPEDRDTLAPPPPPRPPRASANSSGASPPAASANIRKNREFGAMAAKKVIPEHS